MIKIFPKGINILTLTLFSFVYLTSAEQARSQNSLKNISTQELVNICMPRNSNWTHFCNGLIQGYLESIKSTRELCIPSNIDRRDIVEILIAPEIVIFSGWIDDWPAIESAKVILGEKFTCK
jgi:hypothetical protein